MSLTLPNAHTVFYLSHCSTQGFLLASTCPFSWMLWNTDVSLKYWIHPRLGCELCLPLKEQTREKEREGRNGEVGSLNKLLSVCLIYGAIRSVQCRLKLNFSSCEASSIKNSVSILRWGIILANMEHVGCTRKPGETVAVPLFPNMAPRYLACLCWRGRKSETYFTTPTSFVMIIKDLNGKQ